MDKQGKDDVASKQEVAVQDYNGQGFIFIDGDKTKDIVAENKEVISKYALDYFKEKYHTDVVVNNVVPARNAAVVILESKHEPKFNTSVIVSIDMNKKKVLDSVTSEEGSIEGSIQTGLYAMAYEDKFSNLDKFVKSASEKSGFIGLTDEAVKKTRDSGYVTNYYYLAMQGSGAPSISNLYISNKNINKESLRNLFEKEKNPETLVGIVISLYTKDKKADIDKVNSIINELKNAEGLPPGAYSVIVNGNTIDVTSGQAIGDSVGTSVGVDEIIKK
ncbi:DUF1672 family protein [Listeria portnoyi]|uniref:DUF1672 family protein n=1 Tax=Listeria portnoyi TaxID=2713504 RepID=UPI001C9C724E|nr:DUF1672 family protein [Listeria portnoyi]